MFFLWANVHACSSGHVISVEQNFVDSRRRDSFCLKIPSTWSRCWPSRNTRNVAGSWLMAHSGGRSRIKLAKKETTSRGAWNNGAEVGRESKILKYLRCRVRTLERDTRLSMLAAERRAECEKRGRMRRNRGRWLKNGARKRVGAKEILKMECNLEEIEFPSEKD